MATSVEREPTRGSGKAYYMVYCNWLDYALTGTRNDRCVEIMQRAVRHHSYVTC